MTIFNALSDLRQGGEAPGARARSLGRPRAASLLEVVVASALIAVGLLAIAQNVVVASRARRQTTERAVAFEAMRTEIERLKSVDTTTLLNSDGAVFPVERVIDGRSTTLTPAAGRSLPGQITVSPIATGNVVRVRTSVAWLNESGGTVEVELTWARYQ